MFVIWRCLRWKFPHKKSIHLEASRSWISVNSESGWWHIVAKELMTFCVIETFSVDKNEWEYKLHVKQGLACTIDSHKNAEVWDRVAKNGNTVALITVFHWEMHGYISSTFSQRLYMQGYCWKKTNGIRFQVNIFHIDLCQRMHFCQCQQCTGDKE